MVDRMLIGTITGEEYYPLKKDVFALPVKRVSEIASEIGL
jgi:hypothetical protein